MKNAKKSLLVLSTLALSGSLLLTGCGSNSNNTQENQAGNQTGNAAATATTTPAVKEKVTLDFWAHWGSTTRRPIIEKIVSDFNASQDHIHVNYSFQPFGDGWTKELAAVAAGNPPDVIIQDIFTVGQRAAKKQATNLSQFINQDPSIKDRFFPQLWDATLYNNEPYALPFNTDTRFLYYNKKAFQEAGLDPNSPPKTWDELLADGQKLDKINGKKIERLGFYPDDWGLFLDNADGKLMMDKNGPNFNTPAKIDALKWVMSFNERLGKSNVDTFKATFGSKQNDPFVVGKLGMTIQTGTYFAQIKDFMNPDDIGYAPVPEMKAGSGNWTYGGGFVLEIPYGAKHPEESFEFMKYMTDVAAQKYWGQYLFDNVANKTAANDPDLSTNNPVSKFATDNMKWTLVSPVPNNAPDYTSVTNPNIESALAGKTDAKTALDKAQSAVQDLMNSNK